MIKTLWIIWGEAFRPHCDIIITAIHCEEIHMIYKTKILSVFHDYNKLTRRNTIAPVHHVEMQLFNSYFQIISKLLLSWWNWLATISKTCICEVFFKILGHGQLSVTEIKVILLTHKKHSLTELQITEKIMKNYINL